ncbi:alcohol dehydrogenase [Salinisphaera orenii MK-B5]|uniref:Alcohol dehydrogenase n=2 Tax=Salinisphaera orenii TaxID=856731 RepID=A0A423PW88_9GAMM|nr:MULTISPECIES: alcohol dehydrogenase [Salinisphaera]ROO29870.1 alcohol dehydrogenase [Salinisphaera orenii MK-B5]ROO30247.1 alcohol dehydrogenase [Salinisphaera halophila YIM 95161]
MSRMQVAQLSAAGADFELVERNIPEPGPDQVRVKIEACGICHSDAFVKDGGFPGLEYPRVPGHEVAGTVDALGDDVDHWQPGQRVGVGWHGGHCFSCESCRRGDFVTCANEQICGISYDGGYAEYMIAPAEALVAIPDTLSSVDAAPLLCAGVTTYNGMRNTGAVAGDVVAIQGIGGLGHLAIQYAHAMGFHTVAMSRGTDKKALAEELGADTYIDTEAQDAVEALQALGGARVIVATAPNPKLMSSVVDGLGVNGRLLVLGASPEPIEVSPFQLLMARRSVAGHPSGTPRDSEDTLDFSALRDIQTRIETYPLSEVNDAYARMINNDARFRVVLTMT